MSEAVTSGRVLAEITVPTVPDACLSPNSRAHWRSKDQEIQRLYGVIRAEAMQLGLQRLAGPVDVEIEIVWPASKRGKLPDQDNAAGYAKVLIDSTKPCFCIRCTQGKPCRCIGCRHGRRCKRPCWAQFGWDGLITDDDQHCIPNPPRVTVRKAEVGPVTMLRLLEAT